MLENDVVDLLKSLQTELINRELQEVVRVEVDEDLPDSILTWLCAALDVSEDDIYKTQKPLNIPGLMSFYGLPFPHLREPNFNPRLPARLSGREDIFSLLGEGDMLVHHPYESFYAVTEFLNAAAEDKSVVAIKITLYRSSGDSPVIQSLINAAENGKQVTAVIELKARFDEKNNIVWSRRLERAGVNVVFGFVGLKTHCKATLVVRREKQKMVRYVHLSTGNYNSQSAKLYTDIGLLTANVDIGADISALFNLLTGFNFLQSNRGHIDPSFIPQFKAIKMAPIDIRHFTLGQIKHEIDCHKKHSSGLIVAKMNALVDKEIIDALYEASQAGVQIRLIVRGICCLRPGVKGLSENIEVISIVDRFLEHSRIYYFQSAGKRNVFLSSADWMTRNMDRRIEILFPIEDLEVKERLINEILKTSWEDNVKARVLNPDGSYAKRKVADKEMTMRSQSRFIELVREAGIKSLPYDEAIRHNPAKSRGKRPFAKSGGKGGRRG